MELAVHEVGHPVQYLPRRFVIAIHRDRNDSGHKQREIEQELEASSADAAHAIVLDGLFPLRGGKRPSLILRFRGWCSFGRFCRSARNVAGLLTSRARDRATSLLVGNLKRLMTMRASKTHGESGSSLSRCRLEAARKVV
jgi:hypothetical protein